MRSRLDHETDALLKFNHPPGSPLTIFYLYIYCIDHIIMFNVCIVYNEIIFATDVVFNNRFNWYIELRMERVKDNTLAKEQTRAQTTNGSSTQRENSAPRGGLLLAPKQNGRYICLFILLVMIKLTVPIFLHQLMYLKGSLNKETN